MVDDLLISKQDYLSSGIHIGMKSRTKDMKKFIYKVREDGLSVLNLKMVDERISGASKFLANFENVMVVGRKINVHGVVKKFAEAVGFDYVVGRFMPGTLTNPNYEKFVEPNAVLLTDPLSDKQALQEAVNSRIPVIALCDTFNEIKNIDFVIPCNNKGRKSLGLIYFLLTREILKAKGEKKFEYKIEDFTEDK